MIYIKISRSASNKYAYEIIFGENDCYRNGAIYERSMIAYHRRSTVVDVLEVN